MAHETHTRRSVTVLYLRGGALFFRAQCIIEVRLQTINITDHQTSVLYSEVVSMQNTVLKHDQF